MLICGNSVAWVSMTLRPDLPNAGSGGFGNQAAMDVFGGDVGIGLDLIDHQRHDPSNPPSLRDVPAVLDILAMPQQRPTAEG